GTSTACELDETKRRDDRPDELQQEEADLRLSPGVDGEHRRADEVDKQVPGRLRVQHTKLRKDEAREDQQRAQDLDELMHESTSWEADLMSRRRRDRVRRTSSGAVAALTIAAAAVAAAALGAGAASPAAAGAAAPLETLVGERLVVGMQGTMPSAALLDRIRRGRVGGVILMGTNVRSAPQVRTLTASLRAAARGGGRRLLIMTDQEGGLVRRFRWAPPAAAAEKLGMRTEGAIRRTGRSTATALERLGVYVDLAPVADVPGVPGSFIAATDRGFSTNPTRAAKAV